MEATTEKQVSKEFDERFPTRTEKRVYVYLKTRLGDRYQTAKVIAGVSGGLLGLVGSLVTVGGVWIYAHEKEILEQVAR